jgi:hypothetical protein
MLGDGRDRHLRDDRGRRTSRLLLAPLLRQQLGQLAIFCWYSSSFIVVSSATRSSSVGSPRSFCTI